MDDELQRIEYKFKETKDLTLTRDKVSSEWGLFSKMNFVTCRSAYHSSCYRIESELARTQTSWERALRKLMWL